jgi:hypothetical protein
VIVSSAVQPLDAADMRSRQRPMLPDLTTTTLPYIIHTKYNTIFSFHFDVILLSVFIMPTPTKRNALQHANPVKRQGSDDVIEAPISGTVSSGFDDSFSSGPASDENNAPLHQAPSSSHDVVSVVIGEIEGSAHQQRGFPQDHSAVPRAPPLSPASNRDRFRQGLLPARTCCNLDLCRAPAGSKITLSAICIAVFPPQTGPDRRYVQLADVSGTVGVTVWNHNVARFNSASVGTLVTLSKLTITNHQGKKSLTMARDSSVEISADSQHAVMTWWNEILLTSPLTCGGVHDVADNAIINVSGVVGHVTSEIKLVNGVERSLSFMHMVDSSGRLDIRSWNHAPDVFTAYIDRPCLIKRVRVTSFAGTKHAELLDGNASVIETSFPGSVALAKFWAE